MKKLLTVFIILTFCMLTACSSKEEDGIKNKVSPAEVKEYMDGEAAVDMIIIDVDSEEEFEEEHIPTAVHVKYSDLASLTREGLDKYSLVIIYSRDLQRSNDCIDLLESMGYDYIYNLGTLEQWPYETAKGGSVQDE